MTHSHVFHLTKGLKFCERHKVMQKVAPRAGGIFFFPCRLWLKSLHDFPGHMKWLNLTTWHSKYEIEKMYGNNSSRIEEMEMDGVLVL